MYKTIEALYKEGVIITLTEEIPVKYARILITILESKDNISGIQGDELKQYQGILKNFHDDPVAYQRSLRDEW